ncbi:MAG TPA: DUF222 domain-containing protein [Acidimicrobiales bacterium]|nr:DUF222 domain-containing protein [Acidimicrobiales bacterium]
MSGSDPSACADTEAIEILQRQLARLESFVTNATAAFDAAGNWVPDGARSASGWLVTRCRLPKARARGMVRRGRSLRHIPHCARAWTGGDITAAQVDVIADLRNDSNADALARDEEMLVGQASTLRYDLFVRAAHYWKHLADPDGVEDDDQRRRNARDVYLDSSFGGMWFGKITLDPISGSIVGAELERLEQAMFETDWAAARAELGRDPTFVDLARTPGQRRADALVEMATRSRTAPNDGRRPTPLFSVLIDYETLRGRVCELADQTVISPGSLLPWLDEAYLERVVFAPDRRVEVSTTARLFSGATRRAIELRDRECTHRYCDIPASSCQVDHIVPSTAGGPTIEENGRLLCGFHNRLRNARPPPDG